MGPYTVMTEWWGSGGETGGEGAEGVQSRVHDPVWEVREGFLKEGRSELKPNKEKAGRKGQG